MSIITDSEKIAATLDRSIDTVYPDEEALVEELKKGEQLRIYAGVDATGTRLHLGHAMNYLMLRRFQKLGHQVIVLVGDFTAMVGDPSDKTSARQQLSKEEVRENFTNFKDQIGRILDLDNKENPVEFRFNSEWLEELNFADVVDLASNFTVQNMLERDVFQRRLAEEKPLYVHEFFYPLMQGYDSVALEADVEIGGTDQTFNMLAGRTLRKRMEGEEKFVVTHPLLEDPNTGRMLMSKSEGRGVFLDEPPAEMFAKVMKIPDSGIIQFFEHCTERPFSEIEKHKKALASGTNPRDVKIELALAIVSLLYSETEAEEAKEAFLSTFSKQETPTAGEELTANKGDRLMDVLAAAEVVPSKSQHRRLVEQGAVTNTDTDEKIEDPTFELSKTASFKIGKHRFVKVIIE